MTVMKNASMKISRHGDLVWVTNIRHLDLDVIVGSIETVTNPLNPFQQGDPICFAPREVLDMRQVSRPPIHLVAS